MNVLNEKKATDEGVEATDVECELLGATFELDDCNPLSKPYSMIELLSSSLIFCSRDLIIYSSQFVELHLVVAQLSYE